MAGRRAGLLDRLLGVDRIAEAFHPPIANNFVHLLIPRDRDPEAVVRGIAGATEPLNRADAALLEACAMMVAERPDPAAERALAEWRGCARRRVNLRGIAWAEQIAAHLDARAPALLGRLHRDHTAVLDAFRAIPRATLEPARINGYLRPEQIAAVLAGVADDLRAPELGAAVDRVEVARLADDVDVDALDHPTLIVYLRGPPVDDDALASAIERVARRFDAAGPGAPLRLRYALPLTVNTTLTQGYYLFKRYLALVGLLDERYDPETGHALARPTRPGLVRALERGAEGARSRR
ncbi:MAG: hypothetical protein R3B09_13305 [Nannocystaceae bacterium]